MTMTRINFDTEKSDTNDLHDSTNPTRITIKKSGKYLISASFDIWNYNSNAYRAIYIYKNHTTPITAGGSSSSTNTATVWVSWVFQFNVWDYIEVVGRHSVWASITLTFTPRDFSAIYLWS